MHAAQDRRSNEEVRVPLDVLVSLAHRDFDEPIAADALNLSRGGLSLRAPYLPEIGARLACRFECPPLGAPLEAEGEVVWAADTGAQAGEFGVRFIALDAEAEAAIRALVGDAAGSVAPATDEATATARLFLDGVPTPIVARVTHSVEDLVTVEQELPFLSLDRGLSLRDARGVSRRGRIGSVDLQLCRDMPKLVMQVVFDEDAAPAAATRPQTLPGDDRTEPDLVAPSLEHGLYADDEAERAAIRRSSAGALAAVNATDDDADVAEELAAPVVSRAKPAREVTQLIRTEAAARTAPIDAASIAQIDAEAAQADAEVARVETKARHAETKAKRAPETAERTAKKTERVAGATADTDAKTVSAHDVANDAAPATGPTGLALVLARVMPLVATSRAAASALWEKLRPALLAALTRARAALAAFAAYLGPASRAAMARGTALLGRFVTLARARLSARAASDAAAANAQKPRRTTSPPPAAATASDWRSRKTAEATPAPAPTRRPIGRYVVLAGAIGGALALGSYAFSGDDAETLTVPPVPGAATPATTSAIVPAPATATPVAATPNSLAGNPAAMPAPLGASMPPATPTNAPMATAPAGPVPTPAALAAPSYVAGSLPPPTYPTLQPTARPAAAPAALPTASPYAVDVRGENVAGHDPTLRTPTAPGVTPAPTAAATTPVPTTSGAREFGDATVSRPQNFTLRMSREVAGISGRRDPAGFDLRIDGALTLDRAAPIAASHPAVATAVIINRGDHADLAIRFREGMAPAYRVTARGAAIEIAIARR